MNNLFYSNSEKFNVNDQFTTCPLSFKCFFSSACIVKSSNQGKTSSGKLLTFDKDDIISSNCDKEKCIYIIVSGIGIVTSYLESGEVLTLCLKGKGQTFGELFHLAENYPALLQALTELTVCKISAASLLIDNPVMLNNILHAGMINFDGVSRLMWIMNAQRIYERIKRALIVLAELHNMNNDMNNKKNPLILTHDDLALLINTDRPSVTRALHKLKKEGFLDLGYQRLSVKIPSISFIKEPLFHTNREPYLS